MGTDLKEARRWLKEQLPPGAEILCAVSGGRDSMALLHLLLDCGYKVTAAHLHHGLRGPEADRDQIFVRDYCKERGIRFRTTQVDVGRYAAQNGLSVEEAARQVRYDFLVKTAFALGLDCVATGHQLEDQAETILLNLTRGTGADGLRGIARRKGIFLRPLLLTSREEIAQYVQDHAVPYVEDGSNQNLTYSRNRIRHKVLPELRQINPSLCEHLSHTAHILAEESHLLDRLVVGMLPAEETADGFSADFATFRAAELALRRRMARLLVGRMPGGKKDLTAVHYDAIASMKAGDCLILPREMYVAEEGGRLLVGFMPRPLPPTPVRIGGTSSWGRWEFTCRREAEAPETTDGDTLVLSARRVTLPLLVGPWRSGDRMAVGRGERTLKRILSDAGVPAYRRGAEPILYSGGRIAGVFRVGPADPLLPRPGEEVLVITRRKKIRKGEDIHGKNRNGSGYSENPVH